LPTNIVVFPTAKPVVFANLTLEPLLGDGIGQQFTVMKHGKRSVRLPEKFPDVGLHRRNSAYLRHSRKATLAVDVVKALPRDSCRPAARREIP
jgi:hypothetical protein